MISFFEATLKHVSVHHVGNKLLDEYFKLSDEPLKVHDDTLKSLLMQYYLTPFEKVNEVFNFYHPNDELELNPIYKYVKELFNNVYNFHAISEIITTRLFEISNHPKIKAGELHVVFFENVQIEGDLHNAIGIFKTETKETYLKVSPENDGFAVSYEQEAISINKLDKGCLIFDTESATGYKVLVTDLSKNNNLATYWKDEFLSLNVRNDNYNQTTNLLGVFKQFVTDKLDEDYEVSKADKVDLLNKSVKYFKEKESFSIDEFANEVLSDADVIASFKEYKARYENEFETQINDDFDISDSAVKKVSKAFKGVLKLDKNFHLYVHGSKELIERGFDEDKKLNFYKVYFREES